MTCHAQAQACTGWEPVPPKFIFLLKSLLILLVKTPRRQEKGE